MKYSERGKFNAFDAYMAGFNPRIKPRVILLLEDMYERYVHTLQGVKKEAFLEIKEQIDHEARIKRKKYREDSCQI